ncbi:MAG: uncharacterized protein PWP21_438 [Thermosediminibacterales bacterium]|nr:uncharacterized protein [Thermosediminibacterales bacterium]
MFIAAAEICLMLYESNTLKEKRQVIKSIINRIKSRFNVSIAEVDFLDSWKRAQLGIACVSNDKAHANSVITSVINFLEKDFRFEITDIQVRIE